MPGIFQLQFTFIILVPYPREEDDLTTMPEVLLNRLFQPLMTLIMCQQLNVVEGDQENIFPKMKNKSKSVIYLTIHFTVTSQNSSYCIFSYIFVILLTF